ncbi:STAS domain-containing protein [Streptomyces sp. NPDC054854]
MNGRAEFRTAICVTCGDAVVRVTGEIDLGTSPALHLALREALAGRPRHLDVDFTRVTFCDCTGLNTLLRARITARQPGTTFSLVHADARIVIRLLVLTETGTLFGLADPRRDTALPA